MKRIAVLVLLISYCFGVLGQNRLSKFEGFLIKGFNPVATNPGGYPDVFAQFDDNMRTIQWHESLTKDYLYSAMAFDTLGYEALVSSENTDTKTYRNCFKGITVEIKEYEGQLSITMSWFPLAGRDGIGYLFTCSEFVGTWQKIPDTTTTKQYCIIAKSGDNFTVQYKTGGWGVPPVTAHYKKNHIDIIEWYSPNTQKTMSLTYNASTQHLISDKGEFIKVEQIPTTSKSWGNH